MFVVRMCREDAIGGRNVERHIDITVAGGERIKEAECLLGMEKNHSADALCVRVY